MKFEEKLTELELIVEKLETGELSLEDSLAEFEKGVGLVRDLTRQLDEVEKRLERLVRTAGGGVELRELEEPGRED